MDRLKAQHGRDWKKRRTDFAKWANSDGCWGNQPLGDVTLCKKRECKELYDAAVSSKPSDRLIRDAFDEIGTFLNEEERAAVANAHTVWAPIPQTVRLYYSEDAAMKETFRATLRDLVHTEQIEVVILDFVADLESVDKTRLTIKLSSCTNVHTWDLSGNIPASIFPVIQVVCHSQMMRNNNGATTGVLAMHRYTVPKADITTATENLMEIFRLNAWGSVTIDDWNVQAPMPDLGTLA